MPKDRPERLHGSTTLGINGNVAMLFCAWREQPHLHVAVSRDLIGPFASSSRVLAEIDHQEGPSWPA
jgi:hypothetical protein